MSEELMDVQETTVETDDDRSSDELMQFDGLTDEEALEAHAYLGELAKYPSVKVTHDARTVIENVPLMPFPRAVIMPGQAFPIFWNLPDQVAFYSKLVENRGIFGLLNDSVYEQFKNGEYALYNYGMLCQLLYNGGVGRPPSMVFLLAIGRQTFEIVNRRIDDDGFIFGTVRIVRDLLLPDLCFIRPHGYYPSWHIDPLKHRFADVPLAYLMSNITRHSWINYHLTSVYYNRAEIMKHVKHWTSEERLDSMHKCPKAFFYWVIANLPVQRELKMAMLCLPTMNHRMTAIRVIVQNLKSLCCADCRTVIAHCRDMFSVTNQGPTGVFVNPGGHIAEVVTLRTVFETQHFGQPEPMMSWFTGYEWTVLLCLNCTAHLGWRFTARSDLELQPAVFYGCSLDSLRPVEKIPKI